MYMCVYIMASDSYIFRVGYERLMDNSSRTVHSKFNRRDLKKIKIFVLTIMVRKRTKGVAKIIDNIFYNVI